VRIERVRVAVVPLLFRLPWFRRFDGYAAWNAILLREPPDVSGDDLICHELCHVWQMQHRPLRMPLSFLRVGYERNPYEEEAREAVEATSGENAGMTNYEQAFAERPEVLAAWQGLSGAIKANMDLRRYELATLAAARRLRSSYCCLAHGSVLIEQFGEPVREIARDHRSAGLDETDVAVMDLAERVVDDATSIEKRDLQRLRDLGLSDAEITDIVLAAAARCFFSKTLDALGVRPDASYLELDVDLREALVVGRPIAER
jgi:uncharacterized peroxidase-related enzyme